MKIRTLSALILFSGLTAQALATTYYPYPTSYAYVDSGEANLRTVSEPIEVSTWGTNPDGGTCEQVMTTSWFELGPGASIEIPISLADCTLDQLGGYLFFGYYSKKNSSPQLDASSKIMLEVFDDLGGEMNSQDGSTYMELDPNTGGVWLRATNMNRKKGLRIRLRGQSGL